jgi:hypothetical protein
MAETKEITTLYVVTDSETSYDNIGDIDGGCFDKSWLRQHIKNHGIEGLLRTFSWMNFQVFEAMREVNNEQNAQASVATKDDSNITADPSKTQKI